MDWCRRRAWSARRVGTGVSFYINRRVRGGLLVGGALVALWALLHLAVPEPARTPTVERAAVTAAPGDAQPGLGLVVAWGESELHGLLAVLAAADIRVTFLPTAAWVRVHAELAEAIARDGHELATAGGEQTDYTLFPSPYVQEQLEAGTAALIQVTGTVPGLVAFPHNRHDPRVRELAAGLGLATVDAPQVSLTNDPAAAQAAWLARTLQRQEILLLDISGDDRRAAEVVGALLERLGELGIVVEPVGQVLEGGS